MRRPRVIIESPFAGDVPRHVTYADCLMLDAMQRGEAPFLGHLLYPRVLDDSSEVDRRDGIEAHMSYIAGSEYMVVGMDLGSPTSGMLKAIELARELHISILMRYLGEGWRERFILRRTAHFL